MGFSPPGYSRLQTAAQRGEDARVHAARQRRQVALLSEPAKVTLLARAIVDAIGKRGIFTQADGLLSGLTAKDIGRLYERALTRARTLDPTITDPT